jgi:hypothetical protein
MERTIDAAEHAEANSIAAGVAVEQPAAAERQPPPAAMGAQRGGAKEAGITPELQARSGSGAFPAAAPAFARAALLLIIISVAVFLPRPSPAKPPVEAVRVCSTSITQPLATAIVDHYSAAPSAFDLVNAHDSQLPCHVRFMARLVRDADGTHGIIGYDAIVAVVHPANPLRKITQDQLRGVFAGRIENWSELGGSPRAIVAKLPDDASDEAQLLATTLLSGVKIAPGVERLPSSSEVVRAVSSGRGSIGLVALSQADPAKVLPLGDSVPNPLTIANHSYPLSVFIVAIRVTSPGDAPDAKAAGLVRYARSPEVQSIVVDKGLVGL